MKITTTIATHYLLRMVFLIAIPCIAFSLWGAYDLWVKYPHQRWTIELHDAHRQLLDKQEARTISATQPAADDMIAIAERAVTGSAGGPPNEVQLLGVFEELTQRFERADRPSTFDDIVCWVFISCILVVPWSLWKVWHLRTHTYSLDDEGLHLPDGQVWSHQDIASMDMRKWMDKSIAWVEHRDGRRNKMDAYLYKNLEHIIGTLAHRFEPAAWNPDGTKIRPAAEVEPAESPEGVKEAEAAG